MGGGKVPPFLLNAADGGQGVHTLPLHGRGTAAKEPRTTMQAEQDCILEENYQLLLGSSD